MSEEILINVTPPETRVAVIENGVLQELIIERSRQRGLVGNIYKGEVCRGRLFYIFRICAVKIWRKKGRLISKITCTRAST